jgi:hypothetical protein
VKETGHFIPEKSRKVVASEVKRTHFVLGSDKSIKYYWLNIIADYLSKKQDE